MEQESQKRKLEETTSCDGQNAAPIYCANNCGFFGSSSTNNLCSKCYKEFLLKQAKQEEVVVAAESKKIEPDCGSSQVIETQTQSNEANVAVEGTGSEEKKKPVTNRCNFCRKRVGLTGFKCRCGHTFCSDHRYSDKHDCVFDYKAAGQDAIAKANPVIKPDKVDKI